jgi:ABC-type transporter Mla subunit MlaD
LVDAYRAHGFPALHRELLVHAARAMPSTRRLEIATGVLVVAGLLSTLTLILTADQVNVQRTYQVTAWLQDAGGLRYGSPVTLSGLPIGKVRGIEAGQPGDHGRVKATLAIQGDATIPEGIVAKLGSSGVFGDSFLALEESPESRGKGPMSTNGQASITVSPGFFDEAAKQARNIMGGVEDLLNDENRRQLTRLLTSAADLAQSANRLAQGLDQDRARLNAILTNLEGTSGSLSAASGAVARRVDPMLDRVDGVMVQLEKRLPVTLDAVDQVMASGRKLADNLDVMITETRPEVVRTLRMVATTGESARVVIQAIAGGQGVLGQLVMNQRLAKDVNDLAVDFASLARQLADQPSRLVFDDSSTGAARERLRRDQERARRTLEEGLPAAPTTKDVVPGQP